MPATLRGDIAPTDTTEIASPSAPPLRAPSAPDGSRNRQLVLGSQMLDYRLKRSSRRTIGFTIDGTGLAITAPRWVTIGAIESAIAEKEKWIFKKLTEWQTRVEQRAVPRIEWKDGAQLPYLGRTVSVMMTSAPGTTGKSATQPAFDTEVTCCGSAFPHWPMVSSFASACNAGCMFRRCRFSANAAGVCGQIRRGVPGVCVVVCGYALGQLFQRRQDPPELAADSFPRACHRLRGRARTRAPSRDESQCALLAHRRIHFSGLPRSAAYAQASSARIAAPALTIRPRGVVQSSACEPLLRAVQFCMWPFSSCALFTETQEKTR
jgi:hypothetical protein